MLVKDRKGSFRIIKKIILIHANRWYLKLQLVAVLGEIKDKLY